AAVTAALFLAGASASVGPMIATAVADTAGPPFVDHAEWAHWGDLSSLRVYPTVAGREAAGQVHNAAEGDEAWTEVLALAPDADIPGMREQFICHWTYAEFAQPGKTSWNLEPWRPVVDDDTMVGSGCNPGGTEEPF
ncbi:MAG: hypothetical protein QOF25_3261, partial [Mycobacterium sp.]|nr:hypothetical protein [Mycobacterium sp.]